MTAQTVTLRESLAVSRTKLANERTLLAYVRTGIAFIIAGVGVIEFIDDGITMVLLGLGLVATGLFFFFWGILRYRQKVHSLEIYTPIHTDATSIMDIE